ncbi:MAG: ParB/RepB/Spo0J family partition protein [Candidatus Paceibacterota bacterium]
MAHGYNDSIFWVDVEKVSPNPFQPRKEFEEARLKDLADSILQYGILQPLVVTRKEEEKDEGGLAVSYELIAGERRLRAAKLAGISQVPVIIRESAEGDEQLKLELAIIENIQREDLNSVDRARAFKQLIDMFGFTHVTIAKKVGKSREYVSNSLRLLTLPDEIKQALIERKITEGHARPLMMLCDNPQEQATLFKDIMLKKLTVREAERLARHGAEEKVRKRSSNLDADLLALEERLTNDLGSRVQIERRALGGKITIDFLSSDELSKILERLEAHQEEQIALQKKELSHPDTVSQTLIEEAEDQHEGYERERVDTTKEEVPAQSSSQEESGEKVSKEEDDDLYSIKNFTI